MLSNHFKKVIYFIVLAWFSVAHAGSYDDFFQAVRDDDPAVIAALLQRGFDPNTVNPDGLTGLQLAAAQPAPQVAELLTRTPQTRVDLRNAHDESPLMLAALHGDLGLCKLLIERGADVNKTGWTPLHYAASAGHVDVMQLLLDDNAYIDAASPNGSTPLMMAARYGTVQAVRLLVDAGADPTLKNQLGMSALDFARSASRPDAVALLGALEKTAVPPALATPAPEPPAAPVPVAADPAEASPAASGNGGW